jgi:NADPH:quinone reductase-like Zn-dependent oxidoreductase
MRALTLTEHGGLDRLLVQDLPTPELTAPDQVRIRVRTAALNHLDLFVLDGLPGIKLRFPHIVGTDAAGVVDQVGAEVKGLRPGDAVVVNPGVSCGTCAMCAAGEDPYCRSFGILGEHVPGTAAEYLVMPARNVAQVGKHLSWAEAAALPLATLTAWRMVVTRAQVKPKETVLIWGIGGGVSLAALQIAKHVGATVIATSSSAAKLERARALGADLTLNHSTQDVAREVRTATRIGAAVVVDSVGEKTWDKSLRALRPGGRLVTCGATSGPMVQLDIRKLFWFQWSLLGSTMGTPKEFSDMMAVANGGALTPPVDSVVPLAEGRKAYERLADGVQLGKVVIEVER